MKSIKLLECTLRDGTYVLDFMIEPETFYRYTNALIQLGYEHIEVGHGLGLGAHRRYSAGFNDETLWQTMQPLTEKAKLYSFFIPYVGTEADIDIGVAHGLYGLRVGMEPPFVPKYRHLLEYAKKQGLFVALNLMKSYTVTPQGLAKTIATVKDLVDVTYVVDSAGFLLPSEAMRYIHEIYDQNGMITLGYHGHNNLSLAVATALEMIDAGVEYIDTTLTGIGRSGGNVPTETMIAVIEKKYGGDFFSRELFLRTLALAADFREYVFSKGKTVSIRGDDILFGYAGFHSSFEHLVRDYAREKGMSFRDLVLDISQHERIKLTKEILDNYLQGETENEQ